VKCSVRFKKDPHPNQTSKANDENITANIIFNLAHLGISIEDSKYFDLDTYFDIVELEMKVINIDKKTRRGSQKDIDNFFL
jgi:hypothetical protein